MVAGKYSRSAGKREENALPLSCRATNKAKDGGVKTSSKDESFPKTQRLLKRSEFIRVQKAGKRLSTPSLLILIYSTNSGTTRLGIAVSKKIGKSVVRNALKRLIREIFRTHRDFFPASADIVVIPKKVGYRLEYEALAKEVRQLFGRNSN